MVYDLFIIMVLPLLLHKNLIEPELSLFFASSE